MASSNKRSNSLAHFVSGGAMAIGLVTGLGLASAPAQAGAVGCGVAVTIADLAGGDSINCGGKLYYSFVPTFSSVPTSEISVTASVVGNTDYLTYDTAALSSATGQQHNFNFNYDVTVLGPAVIKGAASSLVDFSTTHAAHIQAIFVLFTGANVHFATLVSLSNAPNASTTFASMMTLAVITEMGITGANGSAEFNSYQQSFVQSPVPLPGTFLLFGTVLAGAGALMRRRNGSAAV